MKNQGPSPLLEVEKSKRITNSGTDTLRDDVEGFMIPELRKYGYDGRLVTADEVNQKQARKDYEANSKTHPRDILFHKASGLFLEIWKQGRTTPKLVLKPFVRDSIAEVEGLPRYNLNARVVEAMMTYAKDAARVKAIMRAFFALDMRFLIMTRTGQFWLGPFPSIKDHQYYLTYRKDKNVLDRVAALSEVKIGKFHSIKKELANEIKVNMYYFNKNNKYDRK
jgi:hypothetical protein